MIKYSEIGLKGKNRDVFEKLLVGNIKHALRHIKEPHRVVRPSGRIFVEFLEEEGGDVNEVCEALLTVFGIASISPILETDDLGFEDLVKKTIDFLRDEDFDSYKTFKVNAKRARKNYPLDSMQINAQLGGKILEAFPDMKVDVRTPEVFVNIEVREKISVYIRQIPGLKGMPKGSSGHATLLLSGGIDSPVAGYLSARRGCTLSAVYFHAPPYTSERARKKVVDLASIISKYAGPIKLYVVNFTDIQMAIYEHCPHDELTIIMRRYMMKIAEHFAREDKSLALITGESIGQVASQTMQSLYVTDAAADMPVFRPLIAIDKEDIIRYARQIDTYETSILPYEDCCTIFVAKHPVTKPRLSIIENSEKKLVGIVEEMLETAIKETEVITVDKS